MPNVEPTYVILCMMLAIGLNALFSAAASAIEVLRPIHVRHIREGNERQSQRLQRILDGRSRLLTACALGSHLLQIALVFLCFILAPGVGNAITPGDGPIGFAKLLLAALVVIVPTMIVNLIFGELVPKSFATLHPHRVALALDRYVSGAAVVMSVLAWPIAALANVVTNRFGGRAGFTLENQAEEEIRTLMESAEETGEIEADERQLIHSVFEFTDTVAREVMTPRIDLDALPVDATADAVMLMIRETGHSRIPLYEETDDQILGIIHAKDLLMAMVEGPVTEVRSLMRTPHFVPESKNLHELLTELRVAKSQMAVVQDEFGGTSGIVTIEDIVEELVGDIVDEYDNEQPSVVPHQEGWLVDGRTHLDDVNREVGSNLTSEQFDTIGGYVFGLYGRQPQQGEDIYDGDYKFTVAETDGRRILRMKVERVPPSAEDSLFGDLP